MHDETHYVDRMQSKTEASRRFVRAIPEHSMSQAASVAPPSPQCALDAGALTATTEVAPNLPAGLIKGLRNYWYPVLASEEVRPGKAVGFTALCENLVA